MTNNFKRECIGNGVHLSTITDSKFKRNRISVNMVVPINPQTVSENALLPLVMRRGCKEYDNFTALNRRLDELYGASLSAYTSKTGANHVITFGISFIDDKYALDGEKLVEECTELLSSIIFNPLISDGAFPIEDVSIEKQNLVDTIEAAINDKRSYALTKCVEMMGRGANYATRQWGTVEGAVAVTPSETAAAYYKLLKTAAVEILFVGAGCPSIAKEIFTRQFEKTERTPQSFQKISHTAGGSLLETTEEMEVAQTKLVMGFKFTQKPDNAAAKLMTSIYGGTSSSKLFLNVREKLSLCYYCAARYDRESSIMVVDSGVEMGNIEKAKAEILLQLEEMKKGNIDEQMIDSTRKLVKNALQTIGDSASSMEEWYLRKIICGDVCSPQEELLKIEAVSREDIIEAAGLVKLDAIYMLTGKGEE